MPNFENFKFRASSIKKLMATPKKAGEVLSEGAKTYLNEIFEDATFGEVPEVSTLEMQKGNEVELEAIRLLRKVTSKFYQKYPENEQLKNEYVTGHLDIDDDIEKKVIDIKCPFHVRTWFRYNEKEALDNYYWQLLTYMWLKGYDNAVIAVCAVPTPDHLVLKDGLQKGFFYKERDLSPEKYAEEEQKLYNLHNFDVIDEKARIKFFQVKYDERDVDRIFTKVTAARKYLQTLQI